MDLSIIIVSWNVKDLLRENLKAIFDTDKNIECEVFVVDNNSADGSAQMVQEEFPQVNLIANSDNRGFAKANNQAIKQAKGKYVLLLNPDMRVGIHTLEKSVNWMDNNSEAGILGIHLKDETGKTVPHIRRFPGLIDQAALILKIPHVFPGILDSYMLPDFDYSQSAVVDSIRGSYFMIRKEVIDEIGGLDEQYFIWFEEVDYCKMAKRAGFKVMYTPEIECLDFVGKSFSQVMGYKQQKMFTESMFKYFKKWHSNFEYNVIYTLRPIGLALAFLYEQFKKIK